MQDLNVKWFISEGHPSSLCSPECKCPDVRNTRGGDYFLGPVRGLLIAEIKGRWPPPSSCSWFLWFIERWPDIPAEGFHRQWRLPLVIELFNFGFAVLALPTDAVLGGEDRKLQETNRFHAVGTDLVSYPATRQAHLRFHPRPKETASTQSGSNLQSSRIQKGNSPFY